MTTVMCTISGEEDNLSLKPNSLP